MTVHKSILVYCADRRLAEQISYVLSIRVSNYVLRLTTVASAKDLLWEASAIEYGYDCVVVIRSKHGDLYDDAAVFNLLKAVDCGFLAVEVQNGITPIEFSGAGRVVFGPASVAIAQIIEVVRITCARKRTHLDGFSVAQIGRAA